MPQASGARAARATTPRRWPTRPPLGFFGIIVGAEFGSAAVGAAILAFTVHEEFIAAWVCLVVGVHFLPLDRVFPGIGMVGLAVAVVLVAVTAFGRLSERTRMLSRRRS